MAGTVLSKACEKIWQRTQPGVAKEGGAISSLVLRKTDKHCYLCFRLDLNLKPSGEEPVLQGSY
jgi:hypothetical protein